MGPKKADAFGLKPIAPELAKIDALKSTQDLPALLAQLDLIGVGAFRSSIQPDAKDSSRYIVYVDQGGTLLPDRDYYLEKNDKFESVRKAYVAHIEKMLTLAKLPDPAANAKAIMALETKPIGRAHV